MLILLTIKKKKRKITLIPLLFCLLQRFGLWSDISERTNSVELWLGLAGRHVRCDESARAVRQQQHGGRRRTMLFPPTHPNYRPRQVRSLNTEAMCFVRNVSQTVIYVTKFFTNKSVGDFCVAKWMALENSGQYDELKLSPWTRTSLKKLTVHNDNETIFHFI